MTNPEMIVTFGKFKGRMIEEIPSSYLRWLAENAHEEDVAQEADAEYVYRTDHHGHFEE